MSDDPIDVYPQQIDPSEEQPPRIYTLPEFYAEKPHGDLLIRDDAGKVWSVFQCHGCQSCWEYDDEKDTVTQLYPHFYTCDEVTE